VFQAGGQRGRERDRGGRRRQRDAGHDQQAETEALGDLDLRRAPVVKGATKRSTDRFTPRSNNPA